MFDDALLSVVSNFEKVHDLSKQQSAAIKSFAFGTNAFVYLPTMHGKSLLNANGLGLGSKMYLIQQRSEHAQQELNTIRATTNKIFRKFFFINLTEWFQQHFGQILSYRFGHNARKISYKCIRIQPGFEAVSYSDALHEHAQQKLNTIRTKPFLGTRHM